MGSPHADYKFNMTEQHLVLYNKIYITELANSVNALGLSQSIELQMPFSNIKEFLQWHLKWAQDFPICMAVGVDQISQVADRSSSDHDQST